MKYAYYNSEKLNQRYYNAVIRNTVMHYKKNVGTYLKHWKINMFDNSETNILFFQHLKTTSGQKINTGMASGNTGKFVITMWLIPDNNNEMILRQNGMKLSHEIAHSILFGTDGFVKEVHRADKENDIFHISFWYWHKIFWKKTRLTLLNIKL